MEVVVQPTHTVHFRYRRHFNVPSSSSSQLCLYSGYSSIRLEEFGNSSNCSLDRCFSIPRKCMRATWCYCLQNEAKTPYFGGGPCNKYEMKLSKYSTASSEGELAGAHIAPKEIKEGSRARGICFYTVTSVVAAVLFVLMLVQHPFVILLDRYRRKAHHAMAHVWAILSTIPFFKIEFSGLENLPPSDAPAVFVSNHQSFLDIYTLLTLGRNFKFISKRGIFLFPVVGWGMYMMGVVPLKRMDSRSHLDCIRVCVDLIKKGASVFFFPEGTRSRDGNLGAFKKGAFSVAAKARVPVVPMTLVGTGKIMPAGMEDVLSLGSVKVVIHKPIEGSDPDMLRAVARSIIADELAKQG